MTTANLATIFGLTLMGGEQTSNQSTISSVEEENQRIADTQWHVKVVQTILENYRLIFEPDDE